MCYVCLQPCHLVINRLKNWLLACSSVANFPERSKLKSAEASTKICQVYAGEHKQLLKCPTSNLSQVPRTITKVYSGATGQQQDVPGGLSPLLGPIGQHVPAKKISAKTSSTDTHLRWEIQKLSSNTNTRLKTGVGIWSDPSSWLTLLPPIPSSPLVNVRSLSPEINVCFLGDETLLPPGSPEPNHPLSMLRVRVKLQWLLYNLIETSNGWLVISWIAQKECFQTLILTYLIFWPGNWSHSLFLFFAQLGSPSL